MGLVDDGDFLRVVRHEEETKELIESHQFYKEICFEVHCAGENGDVPVAGLVHRGDRVEVGCPGGLEDYGAVF